MTEPNYRAAANFIMGCKGMEEDAWRDEIITTLKTFARNASERERLEVCKVTVKKGGVACL